jgi:hypothetical protein
MPPTRPRAGIETYGARSPRIKGAVRVADPASARPRIGTRILTAVVQGQDASTADLMRCANAGASLMAALAAKPIMSLPKPWPAKVLRIVTLV